MRLSLPTLGICAILVAEAAAFAYAIIPDVSSTYRAVLIDRTSACIPRSASGTFTPGTPIVLDRSTDRAALDAIRVCGFADPGSEGTATVGPEARLRLSHDGPLTLTIEARSLSDLPRIVHVAGSRLEVTGEFTALSIPLAVPSNGVTELEFRTEPPPGAVGAGWRGILVRSLRFDPAQ
jgi:hypothetical protein